MAPLRRIPRPANDNRHPDHHRRRLIAAGMVALILGLATLLSLGA